MLALPVSNASIQKRTDLCTHNPHKLLARMRRAPTILHPSEGGSRPPKLYGTTGTYHTITRQKFMCDTIIKRRLFLNIFFPYWPNTSNHVRIAGFLPYDLVSLTKPINNTKTNRDKITPQISHQLSN